MTGMKTLEIVPDLSDIICIMKFKAKNCKHYERIGTNENGDAALSQDVWNSTWQIGVDGTDLIRSSVRQSEKNKA